MSWWSYLWNVANFSKGALDSPGCATAPASQGFVSVNELVVVAFKVGAKQLTAAEKASMNRNLWMENSEGY